MKHGDITRHGDEFNRDDMCYCAKCNNSHTRAYPGCDGLRLPLANVRNLQAASDALTRQVASGR